MQAELQTLLTHFKRNLRESTEALYLPIILHLSRQDRKQNYFFLQKHRNEIAEMHVAGTRAQSPIE